MAVQASNVQRIASENFAASSAPAWLPASATASWSNFRTRQARRRAHPRRRHQRLGGHRCDRRVLVEPRRHPASRGATVGFTINFLNLAVATDLTATASVRRRGGTLCTGDVSVTSSDADGREVAAAIVTYKLTGYRTR